MNAIITIIVPVYNSEKYLARCIESLLFQTIKNIDIVLVDDGSTDSSSNICDEYADKDKRVQVIHKQNAGQGLARNDGIGIATGKYICFLDSDDYYENNTCEKLVKAMEDSSADICSYGYQIDDSKGNIIRRPQMVNRTYYGESEIREFILHYFGDSAQDETLRGVSSCMSVFKKSIIVDNNIHFPSERVVSSEDTAFCLEYCKYVKKALTISDSLYHYCQNEASFSQAYRVDRLKLMKAHIEMLDYYAEQYNNFNEVKDRIARTAWINLIAYYKQVYKAFDRKQAVRMFEEAGKYDVIREALCNVDKKGLPIQQRVLYEIINRHIYIVAFLIVGLKVRNEI